jgi:membrane protein GlpM
MTALLFKCSLGAFAVLLIALLSRSRGFYVAGLVPLFPTFALIAHWIVGSERGAAALRTTALFGLWSLLPYAAYLGAVYGFSARFGLLATLLLASLVWLLAAAVLLLAWMRLHSAGSHQPRCRGSIFSPLCAMRQPMSSSLQPVSSARLADSSA